MAFCLVVNLTTRNKLQWNINRNSYIFIHENAFECVVCEMAAICLGINVLTCNNSSTEGSLHTRQWCSSMNAKTHLRTWWDSKIRHLKALLLLREEYSRINISLPWVLMPWLMWFLGQQYPWWWLCRIRWKQLLLCKHIVLSHLRLRRLPGNRDSRYRHPTASKIFSENGFNRMTSSNANIFRVTGHLCRNSSVPGGFHTHKGQWRGALMFSLICTRINGWVNNGDAGDLRRHRAHYDVTVMRRMLCSRNSHPICWNQTVSPVPFRNISITKYPVYVLPSTIFVFQSKHLTKRLFQFCSEHTIFVKH